MVVHQPAYLRPGTPPPVGRRPPYASGRCAVWRLACGGRGAAGLPGAHICSAVRARAEQYCLHVHLFVRIYVFAVVLSTALAPARSGTAGWSCAAAHPLREDPSMPCCHRPGTIRMATLTADQVAVTWRPERRDGSRPQCSIAACCSTRLSWSGGQQTAP